MKPLLCVVVTVVGCLAAPAAAGEESTGAVAITEPNMRQIYNTVYGTNVSQGQLKELQLPDDQRWIGSDGQFRFLGSFTVELNSCGLYLDAGQAEEAMQLVPLTHSLGFVDGPLMPLPGAADDALIGFYVQTHLVPDERCSEDALNTPESKGGNSHGPRRGTTADWMVAYAAPTEGTFLLGFKDNSSDDSVFNDIFIEVVGLTPVRIGDLDLDGAVNATDRDLLDEAWGPCSGGSDPCWANFDGNGTVDQADRRILQDNRDDDTGGGGPGNNGNNGNNGNGGDPPGHGG